MLGTDLEGIEGDDITVEIFPNRPDLLSQQGFSRAMASFLDIKPGLATFDVIKGKEKVFVDKSVAECRPYTACAIVRNLKISEERLKEIIQIQEKLHVTFGRNRKRAAIGIYPIEHITFPIHFIGLKPSDIKFRPLEASKEMTAKQILEEHPKGKEYASLLNGLKKYACFIDSKDNIMSLTPIINSHLVGKISTSTKEVFVECSGFDLRIMHECLNMIVTSLSDMGGTIESMELEYPDQKLQTPKLDPWKIKTDATLIGNLIGIDLKEKDLITLFAKMGIGYEKGNALIPAYRTDIMHQADLAEDVAIAYGYENIPEILPNVQSTGKEAPIEIISAKVREILIGHGLQEVKNFNLISADAQGTLMLHDTKPIRVAHAVSEEYDTLRSWILPSLMETLKRNRQHEYPQRIFEIGRTFGKEETVHLSVALCGEHANYTGIKQILDDLLSKVGVEMKYAPAEHPSFISGRDALVGEGALIGEIHPKVLSNFGLEMPAAAFEIDLSALLKLL